MEIVSINSDSTTDEEIMSNEETVTTNTPGKTWSMEILPNHVTDISKIPDSVDEVYITMIPGANNGETIDAAIKVQEAGKLAIPHIAARGLTGHDELKKSLSRLQAAGIQRALLIGGGFSEPMGEFESVMDMLNTGLFAEYGFQYLDLAGHPEGNPDDPNSEKSLMDKLEWARQHDVKVRIVTQWCLDTDSANQWISGLRANGVNTPIHMGIPGPSTIKTMLRFAKVCGVKASSQVLRKQGLNITKLMFVNKPDKLVSELEGYNQLHLYPFGGVAKSSDWLKEWLAK